MKANIEDKGVKGDCTPLMEAANAGYVDIVQLLIANGADVNAKSTAGDNCIFEYFYDKMFGNFKSLQNKYRPKRCGKSSRFF